MSITIVNTEQIAHYSIKEYKGMVTASQVVGANMFSDLFASFTDVFGGNSGAYREKLENLCEDVTEQLANNAEEIGANAIVGFRIEYDQISGKGMSMFMVSCVGTAVVIEPDRYEIYEKLHNLNVYLKDGLLTKEQYEFERDLINKNSENYLDNDLKKHIEKKEEERAKAEAALEKERKRKAMMKDVYNNKELIIEEKRENLWIMSPEGIQNAKLPDTLKGSSLDEVIINFIAEDKFNEAGKYYMKETGADAESAYDYIYSIFESEE